MNISDYKVPGESELKVHGGWRHSFHFIESDDGTEVVIVVEMLEVTATKVGVDKPV